MLNSKAQLTVDVTAKVAERKITIANAIKLLNKSRRTAYSAEREHGFWIIVNT